VFANALGQCAQLDALEVAGFGLLLATLIELVTVCFRFGLRLQATRDTRAVGRLTGGVRIHHGYFGIVLAPAAWSVAGGAGLSNLLLIGAIGLSFSDLVHHFLVLWPITGSPEFDLVYPRSAEAAAPA
jgi:hypothetical protein